MKSERITAAAVGAFSAVALTLSAGTAWATNGYIANGYGGAAKGMAGAGVAVGGGVLSLAQNPAHGVNVGNQAGLCTTHFIPQREATISGAGPFPQGSTRSENEYFLIPCGGVNVELDEKSTFALIVFGNGGMNTEYQTNLLGGSSPLGVDLAQAFVSANYTRRIAPGLDVGIAPVFVAQRFKATGLEAFIGASTDGANVTNNGYDWSYGGGIKLGVLWKANDYVSFGASYQSRMYMTEFDKYAGLFAEQGDFDVPPIAIVGIAVRPAPNDVPLTLTAEYQRIWYGDVNSISNTSVGVPPNLGADNGAGFGWDDMDVYRLAAIYKATDALTLRTGVSYSTEFAEGDESLFNILAPATPQWHASVGLSYRIDENWGFTGSYTHAFSNTVSGANPGFGGQNVEIEMQQHEIAAGFTYRW